MHTPAVQKYRAANKDLLEKGIKHTHAHQLVSQLKHYLQAIFQFFVIFNPSYKYEFKCKTSSM